MFSFIKKPYYTIKNYGFKDFFKKLLKKVKKSLFLCFKFLLPFLSLIKIKKIYKNFDLEQSLEEIFNTPFFVPNQVKSEILELLSLLQKEKPKYVLEIGTENGGMLFLFSLIADARAKIITIDLPGGRFGGGYPLWKIPFYKSLRKENQKIYLLREDSHEEKTLKKVKTILSNQKLDLLFIDGDHTYEGVKKDFKMYSSLVRKKGLIVLHDIVPGPEENVGGVPKFWKEIRKNYQSQGIEIVENWSQNGYGLGVIIA